MMKSFYPLIVGLAGAAVLLLTTASARDDAKNPKADVTIRDADDGKTVHAKANQLLEIRLESNPSTGYSWYAVGGRDNDGKAYGNMEVSVLAPYGEHEYVPKPAPQGMTGGGGTDVFYYIARKPGSATLRFIYMQSWEKGEVGKRESFKVVVE